MKHVLKLAAAIAAVVLVLLISVAPREWNATVQGSPTPTPTPVVEFDQKAAIAKLKEQIKGRETEAASKVFKNVNTPMLKDFPAARLLAVMEFGYARSLGVNCTHCHVADNWASEQKPQKQIARDMQAMVARITGELLKDVKNLSSPNPIVNCTTCHRGEIKPATNMPTPK